MLAIHDLPLFIAAGVLLNITPGPDTAYIIGRSVQFGWRGGALAALGIGCGCLVHVVGAAIGLSALLSASATAFTVLKLIGAAYLIYSGVRMVLAKQQPHSEAQAQFSVPLRQNLLKNVFWQGALTNALNPKVALFFLAFLPQFVTADAPHQALSFLLLGLIFVTNGTLWCLGVAALAAHAAGRLRRSGRAMSWLNRAIGGLLAGLGIRVALLDAR